MSMTHSALSSSSTGSPSLLSPPPPPSSNNFAAPNAVATASPGLGGLPLGEQLPPPSAIFSSKHLIKDQQMDDQADDKNQTATTSSTLDSSASKNNNSNTATSNTASTNINTNNNNTPCSTNGRGLAASGAKPPVMQTKHSRIPQMPISFDLDDSDDEPSTSAKIAPQDMFVRTGNPFGGFAPQPRYSPLPLGSPIVIGQPMPLSPLAPFSPLPADSPAHNAPNPVHPPVNQAFSRSSTSGSSTQQA